MSRKLAVDIGTTTVALSVVDTGSAIKPPQTVIENPQRLYGSDVLSRMNNAAKQKLAAKMRTMIRKAICDAAAAGGADWHSLSGVTLSGNTLMTHLFHGLDVSGMLAAPFTPAELSPAVCDWDGVPVISMPAVSAFVGGDIVSGIYALDLIHSKSPVLFADLGTNGELVLFTDGRLVTSSVAAGPAFEGGSLSIGMPALPGAIDALTVKNGFCRVHTIDDVLPPKGLCGSGLIEAVYELLQDGILDRYGSFLSASYRDDGFPLYAQNAGQKLLLTQADIRAFQVAKAAVRAGMDTLLSVCGLQASDIGCFYLAGSFGTHLDIKKASGTGLIPDAFISNTSLVGNTSLAGAIRLSQRPDDIAEVADIARHAESVSLADSDFFKEAYIRYMEL